ncbi:hypothetical protein EVAR_20132_1 [Eumeta japonica]|uniref:Reverse transcriptase domain-containing protein n=1 Tax=Eumeta variegata TaxID=151549 RepID=A0A4C1V3W0_EUMVA|nr:hypothetical protein EVAR_20132_1 [Eumeta japonica]
MVSLDIEGAFDNAWWPVLKTELLAYKCPVILYSVVRRYLRDWKDVHLSIRRAGQLDVRSLTLAVSYVETLLMLAAHCSVCCSGNKGSLEARYRVDNAPG